MSRSYTWEMNLRSYTNRKDTVLLMMLVMHYQELESDSIMKTLVSPLGWKKRVENFLEDIGKKILPFFGKKEYKWICKSIKTAAVVMTNLNFHKRETKPKFPTKDLGYMAPIWLMF